MVTTSLPGRAFSSFQAMANPGKGIKARAAPRKLILEGNVEPAFTPDLEEVCDPL